jgi:thiamine-phosphate pyrophosphorylase
LSGPAGRPDPWGLEARRLYLCTPDRPDLERFVAACIEGGVDLVQLRDKHLPDRQVARRSALIQRVCRHYGVPFVLNDRPDLAAAIGAGVHLGQDDLSPVEARLLVGDSVLVGLSTHASSELATAIGPDRVPVDYISAGPVVPTPTKPGRAGTGTAYVAEAAARSPWPVWVTGGVAPDRVGDLVDAGARHFVVVRWLTEADDPRSRARVLRQAIDDAVGGLAP